MKWVAIWRITKPLVKAAAEMAWRYIRKRERNNINDMLNLQSKRLRAAIEKADREGDKARANELEHRLIEVNAAMKGHK